MRRLIGEFKLKNKRRVYLEDNGFVVEQVLTDGRIFQQNVSHEIANYLYDKFRGSVISVKDADNALSNAHDLNLPYYKGYKLGYFAQEALIVLAAQGKAHIDKIGIKYEYTIL